MPNFKHNLMSIEPYTSKRGLIPSPKLFIWVNAIFMLVGIFVLGWSARSVVIAYFFETIVIGLIHILKMIMVAAWGKKEINEPAKPNQLKGPIVIPFFIFHYFFFIFVQSIFVFLMVGIETPGTKEAFHVFRNYTHELSHTDTQQAIMLMVISHLGLTVFHFIIPGKYKTATLSTMFMQPYLRIVIQQVVVLTSGFFFIFLDGAQAAAIILIVLRLVIDLALQDMLISRAAREKWVKRLTRKSDNKVEDEKQLDSFLDQQ